MVVEWFTENWEVLVKIAAFVLSLVGGVASVPLIGRLKSTLGWAGRKVQFLTLVVSVAVAFLTLVVSGLLTPEPITSEYILSSLLLVMVASQAEYQRLKAKHG